MYCPIKRLPALLPWPLLMHAQALCAAPQEGSVTLEVEHNVVTVQEYMQTPKPVEDRLRQMDVYALSKSSYLLRSGHMLSLPLYESVRKGRSLRDFEQSINQSASRYGLPRELIAAVIMTESGFNPQAVSPKGARGLMQLMPHTWMDMGVSDPHDPAQNISAGSGYLKKMLDMFKGDLTLALAAYNAGPQAVRNAGGVPAYAETRQFVAKVMNFYEEYCKGATMAGDAP